MNEPEIEIALRDIAAQLTRRKKQYALVGGLAVSIRGEVRFTRDVDVAVFVSSDVEAEALVRELRGEKYSAIALVEHDVRQRLATVRLRSPSGIVVDLLVASSGIEEEVVSRSEKVTLEIAGDIPVARAEELLALKILAMTEKRPQDRIDANNLVAINPALDMATVRDLLERMTTRGYHRDQDLGKKLESLLSEIAKSR